MVVDAGTGSSSDHSPAVAGRQHAGTPVVFTRRIGIQPCHWRTKIRWLFCIREVGGLICLGPSAAVMLVILLQPEVEDCDVEREKP